jgi:DNA-binding NtrC family response regulator
VAVGSDPSNDLAFDDPALAPFQCEISARDTGFEIRDVSHGQEGILVDGVRAVQAFLREESRIHLGSGVFEFGFGDRHEGSGFDSAPVRFGTLVAGSPAMRATCSTLKRVAERDVTVLLVGETGTGKTQAAHAIHVNGARCQRPFVVVDCGTITGSLLESELFGHERGAFTGASTRRIGAFEEANKGTIFLDEVGELPLELQPKLLRALEARSFRRIGSNQHIDVDVRVIAATNRDLSADILAGRFREDLFFRLGVITVELPSLRGRREDLGPLVEDLLRQLGATPCETAALTARPFIERLALASWPGNVRELRNFLERCLVLGHPQWPDPSNLPVEDAHAAFDGVPEGEGLYALERERALARFEYDFFEGLLRAHEGRVAQVAKACGLDRRYVYRILKKHGLRAAG